MNKCNNNLCMFYNPDNTCTHESTVVMVMDFSGQRMCKVALMKMPNRIDKFCQTLATLEEMEDAK